MEGAGNRTTTARINDPPRKWLARLFAFPWVVVLAAAPATTGCESAPPVVEPHPPVTLAGPTATTIPPVATSATTPAPDASAPSSATPVATGDATDAGADAANAPPLDTYGWAEAHGIPNSDGVLMK